MSRPGAATRPWLPGVLLQSSRIQNRGVDGFDLSRDLYARAGEFMSRLWLCHHTWWAGARSLALQHLSKLNVTEC